MPMNPEQWADPHEGRLLFLLETLRAAGNRTLDFYTDANLTVDRKSDDSPVTEADRQAEQLVRQSLRTHFASDGLLGEEFGTIEGTSGYNWIVDPIDGTKSFICGVPLYSTLFALLQDDQPIAGGIYLPGLRETVVAANSLGAWHSVDQAPWREAKVSQRKSLEEAVFVSSQIDSFGNRQAGKAYLELERRCAITRTWGDGYGYALLATGRADVMVDPTCSAWDIAPMPPILSEAGGTFTDWSGRKRIQSGDGVGTNGHLHEEVLGILSAQ